MTHGCYNFIKATGDSQLCFNKVKRNQNITVVTEGHRSLKKKTEQFLVLKETEKNNIQQ